ncbi:hypothetical protein HD554DRAFT_2114570 [Boletus coccyginus]|nr:hypothetical protein HD554DRAFT_2114570 [Boletus coccyginus]
MKFTIPAYLILACLANALALPVEETGIIRGQDGRTKADSFPGAYAQLTEPGENTLPADKPLTGTIHSRSHE